MTNILEWPQDQHDPGGKVRLGVSSHIQSTARFSSCGRYRQLLTRCWDPNLPPILFIGMNPSTADQHVDDPTVRKECGYAQRWGYGSLIKCHVMDYRATHPKDLLTVVAQSDENLPIIQQQLKKVDTVVAVWGKLNPKLQDCATKVWDLLKNFDGQVMCLGTNQDNSPRHPLYLKNDAQLQPYRRQT